MKLYTLDGYVFVCPCAVMRLNRILRFDTCSNPQTKYWSCNHPETFKTYIIYTRVIAYPDKSFALDSWLAITASVLQLRAVGLLLQCANNTQPSLKHHGMQVIQDQRLLQTFLQLVHPLCLNMPHICNAYVAESPHGIATTFPNR